MTNNSLYTRRRIINGAGLTVSVLAMGFGLFWLCWILWTLLANGLPALTAAVFTQMTPPPGSSGGLLNAINDILLSAPSIVIGLFVYEVYVVQVKHFSGWAGALALAILVIPIVIRTTENMLRLVPSTLREAAAALGAPQWKIVNFVTLRAARAGIITGIMLAIARISGETAPLLFTALNNQFWSSNMDQPMASLPGVIFQFAMSPYEDWKSLAWAGALLITISVLTLNILARVLFRLTSLI
ncbi:MAG: ABC transporter permease subunit [Gallionella sp.]